MKLVQHNHIDIFQKRISLQASGQNCLGNHFKPGPCRNLRIKMKPVTHRSASFLAQQIRKPVRNRTCSKPARFKHQNFSVKMFKQSNRHGSRFSCGSFSGKDEKARFRFSQIFTNIIKEGKNRKRGKVFISVAEIWHEPIISKSKNLSYCRNFHLPANYFPRFPAIAHQSAE